MGYNSGIVGNSAVVVMVGHGFHSTTEIWVVSPSRIISLGIWIWVWSFESVYGTNLV